MCEKNEFMARFAKRFETLADFSLRVWPNINLSRRRIIHSFLLHTSADTIDKLLPVIQFKSTLKYLHWLRKIFLLISNSSKLNLRVVNPDRRPLFTFCYFQITTTRNPSAIIARDVLALSVCIFYFGRLQNASFRSKRSVVKFDGRLRQMLAVRKVECVLEILGLFEMYKRRNSAAFNHLLKYNELIYLIVKEDVPEGVPRPPHI